ncbi:vacuolar sorting-associated 72-like protein [Labeo rohita]|uniref:Vacuolar protein sorting-associated protein 72 homolog n=1 Tax=Labeo rohita TaxID=84645 RepID=A0A498P665_LABRO|nr:vacuolar sorting-associated 72-like protein [Labeo rohita]
MIPSAIKYRKSVRQSTTEHTRLTYLRLQERQVAPRRRKGTRHERPLTQAELLAEAKVTAEINLRSLENYERLEADKKRQVHMKRQCVGSVIRYHSVLMPLVSDVTLKEENVDVEGLDQDAQQNPGPHPPQALSQSDSSLIAPPSVVSTNTAAVNPSLPSGPAKCSRTYITFSDDESFQRFFPQSPPPRIPVQEICPVTHKPALYRDPITDIPYANVQAFRIIREAYKKYVAAHGLPCTGTATPADSTAKNLRQKIIIKQGM